MTTLTLNNLTPGDSYKVQMRSRYYNADRSVRESSGPWTNTPTQRVKDHPPAAPTGLIAARIGHSVLTLTWDDPQDANITGYRVMRGTDAGSLYRIHPRHRQPTTWPSSDSDTASNATEYEDDTVAPETAYHYAVLARSANGEGAQSDIISATTPAAPKSKEQPRRSGARQDTPIPHRSSSSATCPKLPTKTPRTAEITDRPSPLETTAPVTALPASPSSQEDPNNDAIPLQICEVDGSVHPTTVCTDLTPPSSYPQGNLTYTVPTTTPLTLDADTTYMLVFKAPVITNSELRVAATSSDDQDAASLTGFSIANAFQWYNTSNTWVIGNFSRRDSHHHHRQSQSNRPRRPHRPLGNRQRERRDQPLLDGTGQLRRLRHHRLQDRIILRCRLQLEQPGRRHRQHQHRLPARRPFPR